MFGRHRREPDAAVDVEPAGQREGAAVYLSHS